MFIGFWLFPGDNSADYSALLLSVCRAADPGFYTPDAPVIELAAQLLRIVCLFSSRFS